MFGELEEVRMVGAVPIRDWTCASLFRERPENRARLLRVCKCVGEHVARPPQEKSQERPTRVSRLYPGRGTQREQGDDRKREVKRRVRPAERPLLARLLAELAPAEPPAVPDSEPRNPGDPGKIR